MDFRATIIDRYLFRHFTKILIVSFVSLTGLYIVIDLFGNLEEFIDLGKTEGGLLNVLVEYYVGRAFLFFDMTSSLLALVSAIFVLSMLKGNHEMDAIMAGGIPLKRILIPLIVAVVFVSVLACINREAIIPNFRHSLVRQAQSWKGDSSQNFIPKFDNYNGLLYRGNGFLRNEQKIEDIELTLPTSLQDFAYEISAEGAFFVEANDDHPRGYLLRGISQPEEIDELESLRPEKETLIYTSKDTAWLKKGECFVPSHLDFDQMVNGRKLERYLSTPELISGLQNPSLSISANQRVTIHARLLQPLLDVSLVMIGLPIILSRQDRNIFVAATLCLLVVAGFIVVQMVCHQLGATTIIPAVTGAWIPLAVFGPVAVVSTYSLFR